MDLRRDRSLYVNPSIRWIYVETEVSQLIPYSINDGTANVGVRDLIVRLLSPGLGSVWADFVQVGEQHSVTGNPHKFVTAGWIPRYRAAFNPGDPSEPNQKEVWRGWFSAGDPDSSCYGGSLPSPKFWQHNPNALDAPVNPSDVRGNGRRDVAVSIDHSKDDVPLIGAYASRDHDVIRWQLEMMAATGIDAVRVEASGHLYAVQRWNDTSCGFVQDPSPLNDWAGCDPNDIKAPIDEIGLKALYDVAGETSMKIVPALTSFAYGLGDCPDPSKSGWLCLQTTSEQLDAIASDLDSYIDFYWDRKCTLKVNGAMPIVFQGSHFVLVNGDRLGERWEDVLAILEDRRAMAMKPERPVVIWGTRTNTNPNYAWVTNEAAAGEFWGSRQSMLYVWEPISPTVALHKYEDLDGLFAMTELSQPLTGASWQGEAERQVRFLIDGILQWTAGDDANRIPVGFVYPDFDNSGILGTLSTQTLPSPLTGYNPLCVQVVSEDVLDLSPGLLERTFVGAQEAGMDWFYVNTWNCWPEFTHLEPVWRQQYWNLSQSMGFDPSADPVPTIGQQQYDEIFGKLITLQSLIEGLKGVSLDPEAFHELTGEYLAAQAAGTVTKYE